MGSSSKRSRDKDSKKRKHHSRDDTQTEAPHEKKRKHHHHHHKHHRDKKREKQQRGAYESDSDVEIVTDAVRVSTPPKSERDISPDASGAFHESLSIDETNKIRAKLGLKPLQLNNDQPKDGKDDGKKKDDYGEFYHRPADSITKKKQQEKIRSRLSDHKERRNIEGKLSKVALLGETRDADDDDAAAWVKKSRKISDAKRAADKRAKELEEMDAQFGIGDVIESEQRVKRMHQYNEQNLRGLQVNHDVDTFREGRTVILTLKDQTVLDEGDDVLVNVNMLDNERYQKSNENKKKKSLYSSYDTEEVDEFGELRTKSLLSKYDEEIDGEKRESFKIGYDCAAERKQMRMQSIKEKLANKLVDTLATTGLTIASDYYSEQEMAKFKKPKRKRKMRIKGKLTADDLERAGQHSIEYDDTIVLPSHAKVEIKMEDENEESLERALHKARKSRQKETLTFSQEVKPEPVEEAADSGHIILNATAEFCRTLGDIPTYGKSGNREESENLLDINNYEDDPMDIEDDDDDDVIEVGSWNAVDPNRTIKQNLPPPVTETPILEEEPDLSSGVGAALKLARSKGYLDKEENNRPSNTRLAYLQAQHYSIEDKNYNDDMERGAGGGGGGGGGANRRERFSGPITDFREKDGYKPNVKLEYIDDEGHVLNAKEAFRYLSHKFHGKGPGKNKVEKRLKKVVQEGLMKKMSSTDTPLGTLNMLQSKQKEMQTPYIVLSGGKHTHSTTISKARR